MIANLIGSGSRTESAVELSKRVLHHYDNDLNKLAKSSISELSAFRGIGGAKAISIIATLKIRRRSDKADNKGVETIVGGREAYNLVVI